jgi:Dolichyl-phosphate-mannose-protein mannosyltransferase
MQQPVGDETVASATGPRMRSTAARPGLERPSRLLLAVLVVGTGMRLFHYLLGRSLWLDEARIALNIASRSWTGLLEPLTYDQSAPLLFLWGLKGFTVALGVHEWALRALPVAAGICVVWLVYPVARHFVGPAAAVMATAIAAFSPSMIFFTNEAKPYSSDALVTLVLVALAAAWHEMPDDRGPWARLTAAGAILVWLSAPAFLVLAGIGCASLLHDKIRSQRVGRLLLTGAVWIVSFGVAYLLMYHPASNSPYLRHYWAAGMLVPGTPDLLGRAWLATRSVVYGMLFGHAGPIASAPVEEVLVTPITVLLVSILALGATHLWQHEKRKAALVLAPLAVTLAGSLIGAYPLGLRLDLFMAGLLLILLAAGVERLVAAVAPARRARVYAAFVAILLAFPATFAFLDLRQWSGPEHSRPLIQQYEAEGGNEPIYVNAGVLPAWAFYTTDWASPDTARLAFLSRIGSFGGGAFENAPSRGHAVAGEGTGLVRTYNGRKEIYGVPTGLGWQALVGPAKPRPDPGWPEHEIARLRSGADSAVWVLLAHLSTLGPEKRLRTEMTRQAKSEELWYKRGVILLRYQLR